MNEKPARFSFRIRINAWSQSHYKDQAFSYTLTADHSQIKCARPELEVKDFQ